MLPRIEDVVDLRRDGKKVERGYIGTRVQKEAGRGSGGAYAAELRGVDNLLISPACGPDVKCQRKRRGGKITNAGKIGVVNRV